MLEIRRPWGATTFGLPPWLVGEDLEGKWQLVMAMDFGGKVMMNLDICGRLWWPFVPPSTCNSLFFFFFLASLFTIIVENLHFQSKEPTTTPANQANHHQASSPPSKPRPSPRPSATCLLPAANLAPLAA